MHYYLADKEAREQDPIARGLLLDGDGYVCEASTANIVAYFAGEGLVSPRRGKILPGICLATIEDFAVRLAVPFHYRDMSPEEFASSDEIWLTSTPFCALPVAQLDGQAVGDGAFGRCHQFLTAWGRDVGVDIVAQATSCLAE